MNQRGYGGLPRLDDGEELGRWDGGREAKGKGEGEKGDI
jgi:hypothetical protein